MQPPRIDLLRDCKTKAPAASNAKSNPFKRTAAAAPAHPFPLFHVPSPTRKSKPNYTTEIRRQR
jgi:hypothetical protein